MTVAADSLRRNGTKDGPGRFARREERDRRRRTASPCATSSTVAVAVVSGRGERANGRTNGRTYGWMGRPTPVRIVIDRQEKRYRRCSAGECAIDRVSRTPLSYTEKKIARSGSSTKQVLTAIGRPAGVTMTRASHARANPPTGICEAEQSVGREPRLYI